MRDAEIQAEVPGRAVAMDRGIRAAPTRQTITTQTFPIGKGVAVQTDPVITVESNLEE